MSESGNTPEDKKNGEEKQSSGSLVWVALALVVGFIILAGLLSSVDKVKKSHEHNITTNHAQHDEGAAVETDVVLSIDNAAETQVSEDVIADADITGEVEIAESFVTPEAADAAVDAQLGKLTKPRILGDPSAPMKISEYSSFTCGHCAAFHKDVFKKIKADYIDTGKAYLVFDDFPLNAPAMHASMVARCIPDENRYFDFVQLLFDTQEDWAYKADYLTSLKQNAMMAGLSEDGFKACLQNLDLQQAIVGNMKNAQEAHKINSTPTLVINDRLLVGGAQPYDVFQKKLDAELSQSQPGE